MTLVYDTKGKLDFAQATPEELRRELAAVDLWEHIVELNNIIRDPSASDLGIITELFLNRSTKGGNESFMEKFKNTTRAERQGAVIMTVQQSLVPPETMLAVIEDDLHGTSDDATVQDNIRATLLYSGMKDFSRGQIGLLGTIRETIHKPNEGPLQIYSELYAAALQVLEHEAGHNPDLKLS